MPAVVKIDFSFADNEQNLPRLRAVMARIDYEYYLRTAKEAMDHEEVSLQQ